MYNPRIDGVTMSMLTTYRTCPTEARMSFSGYYFPGTSAALIYGSVFHEAMDICLNCIKAGIIKSPEDFDKDFMTNLLLQLHGNFEEEYNAAELKFKEEFIMSFGIMRYLIPEYFKFWKEDFFGDNKKEYVNIEEVFNVPFAGTKLRGKKDGVFLDTKKHHWLLEHKTKSQIKEDALSMTVARDFQNNLYMLAHYLETGIKMKGVLYNIVRKSSLRKKVNETGEEYVRWVGADIKERPDFYFVRFLVGIDWKIISSFSRKLAKEVSQFLKWWETDEKFDSEYTHSCSAVYGTCPYIQYCDSGHQNFSGLEQRELFPELNTKPAININKGVIKWQCQD